MMGSPGQAGGGLTDVLSWMKNGVAALNLIATSIGKVFPQMNGTSTSASAGAAAALPPQPAGYLLVEINGDTFKVPMYNP